MKKTRLLSMLLAVSMAASSIPMMAATVSAAEAKAKNGNLLENAATSVTVNSVPADLDESGNPNKFAHTRGRIFHNNNDQGIYIYYEIPEEYAGRTDLKLAFDMRVSVPVVQAANDWQAALRYGFDVTNGSNDELNYAPMNGGWVNNIIPVTANTAGDHFVFFRKSSSSSFSFPMDIDNINLCYMEGDNEVSLPGYPITDDFDGHVGMNVGYVDPGVDDAYSYLSAPASGNTTVTYTFAEPLTPGYYTLSGEMRLGTIIANWREGANNDNNTVINLIADGEQIGNFTLYNTWSQFDYGFLVEDSVDSITITADCAKRIDLDEFVLECTGVFDTNDAPTKTPVEGDLIPYATLTGATSVTPMDSHNNAVLYNEYLHVYNRRYQAPDDGIIVNFTLSEEEAAKNIYMRFNVRTSTPTSTVGRPDASTPIRFYVNGKSGSYVACAGFEPDGNWVQVDDVNLASQTNNDGTSKLIAGNNTVGFHKHWNNHDTMPYDIDDLSIYYYDEDGEPQYILGPISNGFKKYLGTNITSNAAGLYKAEAEDGYNEAVGGTKLTYNFSEPLVPGCYKLEGLWRIGQYESAPDADNEVLVRVESGDKTVGAFRITTEWAENGDMLEITETTDSLTLTFDSRKDIHFDDVSLVFEHELTDGGIPNSGIIMVLLAKKRAGTNTDADTEAIEYDTVEYVVNGDFEAGFDSSKVTNTYNGLAAGTWMNHTNYATKLETVDVKGNKVLSVSGIQTNWSGIAYGVGELQPGKYKMSVDIKLANASDSCGMRVSVNSNANMEEYIAGDNYDIHSIDGKKWTTVEYTFTVTEATVAAVRIRGGTAGAPDTKPYYIDNLSVTTEVEKEIVEVTETVEYVVNADFEAGFDSSKVTNTYNGLAAGTWMNHTNYATKLETVDVKGNKVLSVSGIQTNWSGIAYGVGELQPGKYKMSVDIKLANASDSCGMRVSVNSNANMEEYVVSDNYDIHSIDGKKWTTVEYTFTVTEATAAAVRIRGGVNGAPDTVPYYIDNLYIATVK